MVEVYFSLLSLMTMDRQTDMRVLRGRIWISLCLFFFHFFLSLFFFLFSPSSYLSSQALLFLSSFYSSSLSSQALLSQVPMELFLSFFFPFPPPPPAFSSSLLFFSSLLHFTSSSPFPHFLLSYHTVAHRSVEYKKHPPLSWIPPLSFLLFYSSFTRLLPEIWVKC